MKRIIKFKCSSIQEKRSTDFDWSEQEKLLQTIDRHACDGSIFPQERSHDSSRRQDFNLVMVENDLESTGIMVTMTMRDNDVVN